LKGYMSIPFQEGFNHAGLDAVFTLEATTPRSRDVYKHLRFEVRSNLRLFPFAFVMGGN
jgi:hypothetical protein